MRSRAVVLGALLGATALQPPAGASTGVETFVTVISEPGDPLLDGEKLYYHPGNGGVTPEPYSGGVTVWVSGGNLGRSYRLVFEAPRGQTLTVGEYTHATGADGDPRVDISGEGRACGSGTGRFVIRQITRAGGEITSLWIVYEFHCSRARAAIIGEVRYEVPGDGGALTLGPREIRWPDADPLQHGMQVVPVAVLNASATPAAVGAVVVEGPAAGEFEIRVDECEGRTLEPGSACFVWVRYLPSSPGPKVATLVVPEATGAVHAVSLGGFVHGGTTRFVLSSAPGEPIGRGGYYDLTPQNGRIQVVGTVERAVAAAEGVDGEDFVVRFHAPPGEVLQAGRTYVAGSVFEPEEGVAGMEVSGDSTVCWGTGEFTVSEIAANGHGEPERLGISFEHRCEGGYPPLRGIVDFRVERANEPPEPFTADYSRRIELRLHRTSVSGRVSLASGPEECVARVRVVIEKRRGSGFEPVGRVRTDVNGVFGRRFERIRGAYRARTPRKALDTGSSCLAATSSVRTAPR